MGRSSPALDNGGSVEGNGMMGMMPNMMGGPIGYGPMMGPMSGDPNMLMMGPMGNMGFNQVRTIRIVSFQCLYCNLLQLR